jgi:hypothetical protein
LFAENKPPSSLPPFVVTASGSQKPVAGYCWFRRKKTKKILTEKKTKKK